MLKTVNGSLKKKSELNIHFFIQRLSLQFDHFRVLYCSLSMNTQYPFDRFQRKAPHRSLNRSHSINLKERTIEVGRYLSLDNNISKLRKSKKTHVLYLAHMFERSITIWVNARRDSFWAWLNRSGYRNHTELKLIFSIFECHLVKSWCNF